MDVVLIVQLLQGCGSLVQAPGWRFVVSLSPG